MKVSQINRNQYKAQNPSFNAINQKYYDWGKKSIAQHKYVEFELLYALHIDIYSAEKINPQDGVDTLKALRKLLAPIKDPSLDEFIGIFKTLAKEQRLVARKAIKK